MMVPFNEVGSDPVQNWVSLASMFLPLLAAVINKQSWSSGAKYAVAFVICLAAAFVEILLSGELTFSSIPDILNSVSKAVALVVGSYMVFWKPSGIAKAVERKVLP